MTRLPENLTFVVVKAHQKPDESQRVWHVLLLTLRCIALLKGNALIWNDLTNLWFSIHRVTFQVLERTKPNLITCLEKFWMTVVGLIYRFLSPCSKDCSSKSQCLMTLFSCFLEGFLFVSVPRIGSKMNENISYWCGRIPMSPHETAGMFSRKNGWCVLRCLACLMFPQRGSIWVW